MKLTPYKKLLTMTKEAIDASLAHIKAKSAKKQAELEILKLEEEIANLETKIQEACSQKELNFSNIINLQDKHALATRRIKQFNEIISELFPD